MIRIYSDEMIVTEVRKGVNKDREVVLVVSAEDVKPRVARYRGLSSQIVYENDLAEKVAHIAVNGMRFTFRGTVAGGQIIGLSFNPLP